MVNHGDGGRGTVTFKVVTIEVGLAVRRDVVTMRLDAGSTRRTQSGFRCYYFQGGDAEVMVRDCDSSIAEQSEGRRRHSGGGQLD
ncbi:hypothetical protein RJT34_18421 [Clitoria ternatea]|uniref:Uncharacterized protein n=1 Tax=Clitoria ternatea TaxID=43366 RepID=A0AAN9JAS1_CLITE